MFKAKSLDFVTYLHMSLVLKSKKRRTVKFYMKNFDKDHAGKINDYFTLNERA